MRRIRSSILITLLSLILPLLMAAYSIPYIIQKLGVGQFGLLTLVWSIFGYFSFFDFGISKTLTKRVAESEIGSTESAIATRIGLVLLLGLGVISGLLIAVCFPLFLNFVKIDGVQELLPVIPWLAFGMPLLMLGSGLRGVLEGLGNFSSPALARIILGVITFGLPVPLLSIWPALDVLVISLVAGRALTILTQACACRSLLLMALRVNGTCADIRRILRLSSWMMLSNLVSPLMMYADRFIIAASPVASHLAYYTTPFELVTRLLILPSAITTTLFPMMVRQHGVGQHLAAERLMIRGMLTTLLVLLPVIIVSTLFANDFLAWWLSPKFATLAVGPTILLCWGVLFNSLAQFPFSYVQSMGKARHIAMLHLLELPVYMMMLPWFLERWGILGAAIIWTIRVAFDFLALLMMAFFLRVMQHDD